MSSPDPIRAVGVSVDVAQGPQPILVSRSDFDNASLWTVSNPSALIGPTLKVRRADSSHGSPNTEVAPLLMDIEPSSTSFGLPSHSDLHGTVTVIRVDGQHTDPNMVMDTCKHISAEVKAAKIVLSSSLPTDRLSMAWFSVQAGMTPERLQETRDASARHVRGGWVQPKRDRCSVCGKAQRDDGSPLLACSKCRGVWYCGQECQKEDWRKHKQVCRKV